MGLTLGMLPLFFIDDNLDNRASDNGDLLVSVANTNGDEYCELFCGD